MELRNSYILDTFIRHDALPAIFWDYTEDHSLFKHLDEIPRQENWQTKIYEKLEVSRKIAWEMRRMTRQERDGTILK